MWKTYKGRYRTNTKEIPFKECEPLPPIPSMLVRLLPYLSFSIPALPGSFSHWPSSLPTVPGLVHGSFSVAAPYAMPLLSSTPCLRRFLVLIQCCYNCHTASLPLSLPNIWTVNVTTYVMVVLANVDDYLSWRTQFSSFVIIHQISGMIDATISAPSPIWTYMHGLQQPNLGSYYWVKNSIMNRVIFHILFVV